MIRSLVVRQRRRLLLTSLRPFRTCTPRLRAQESEEKILYDPESIEREGDDVDVCIVGAGPAGLSAAIRIKQLDKERGTDTRVVVLEKGPDVGSHILSGAVIEPRALNELLPDWSSREGHPLTQPATSSTMRYLTPKHAIPIPHPPQMSNKGNYVVSLSRFVSWLGSIAQDEEHGVEIYPGFAGARLLYTSDGKGVRGVATGDVGVDKRGFMKEAFEPGMEFRAKVTLLAEGAHGSLTKQAVNKFDLRENGKIDAQTYGIGIKEVWRVDPSKHRPGEVVHTMGYPLDWKTYGGGWIYHMDEGLVSLGLVIGLDYKNPYLSPYGEFQKMKLHPHISSLLEGGERLAYGGRTLNEGGYQSIPRLHFPGGALIGCSAGFVNVPKIKGTHNAMKSGMLAAEAAFEALHNSAETSADAETETGIDLSPYETALRSSWVNSELYSVRNIRPSFNTSLGIWGGIAYSGVDTLLLKGRTPWTFKNKGTDAGHTGKASEYKPIAYPAPQAPLTTDILTSLSLTSTNHAENQEVHLRLPSSGPQMSKEDVEFAKEARRKHIQVNVGEYAGLLGRACPAAVYEYVDVEGKNKDGEEGERVEDVSVDGKKFVINSQNCIHCKLCDIKVPTQDITWTVPEGGGGPKYTMT